MKLIERIQWAGKWALKRWQKSTAPIRHPFKPKSRCVFQVLDGNPGSGPYEDQFPGQPDSHQAALTAKAIRERDIQRGCETVKQIDLPFLLRRIAGSARQDAIRMTAALRLDDRALIHMVTLNVEDISLRWRGARYLNDPLIMTDVAVHKQCDERYDDIRSRAHRTLIQHLDTLRHQRHWNQLLEYLYAVKPVHYKVEAFVRLSAEKIEGNVLGHMAVQDYRYVPETMLENVFTRIQTSGWHTIQVRHTAPCDHCRGRGQIVMSSSAGDTGHPMSHLLACPECGASGKLTYLKITCARAAYPPVVFQLPEDRS